MKFEENFREVIQRCGWTDGRWTDDDGWQVITIAHPEHLLRSTKKFVVENFFRDSCFDCVGV